MFGIEEALLQYIILRELGRRRELERRELSGVRRRPKPPLLVRWLEGGDRPEVQRAPEPDAADPRPNLDRVSKV